MLREPSVSWLPNFGSSPCACATFILAQSASSSSATTSGQLVRTPCPISERWHSTVTVPSSAMAMKILGSSRRPLGMPSPAYFGGSSAARADKPTLRMRLPAAIPVRNARRLTLAIGAPSVWTSMSSYFIVHLPFSSRPP